MDITKHPDGLPCNFYCRPPHHAVGVLADPPTSPAALLADVQVYFRAEGWTVLEARPAREADLAQWRQRCTLGFHPDGTCETQVRADDTAEPWLLIVEARPYGDH